MSRREPRPARGHALKRIAALARDGRVRLTKHWRDRASQRGFDVQDFRAILRTGRIDEEGEWDEENQNFKFRVVGRDADGGSFTIVVALSPDVLFLISGMRKVAGRWQSE